MDQPAPQPTGEQPPANGSPYLLAVFQGQPRDDVADFIVALRRLIELQDRVEKTTRHTLNKLDTSTEAVAFALSTIIAQQERQQQQIQDLACQLQRFLFDNS